MVPLAHGTVRATSAWYFLRRQRTRRLRAHFGPEYDRLVHESHDQTAAERELERREHRVRQLDIHSLPPRERERYAEAWRVDQARFVDDPKEAVLEADHLITEVMNARGYPVGDFEQRAADVSVDHPDIVANYRAAREIVGRYNEGKAGTEDPGLDG